MPQPLNAGEFKRRIEIQQLTTEQDSDGYSEENWQSVKKLWAKIKTMDDRINAFDFYSAGKEQSKNTNQFQVRYTTGIDAKMRVVYKSRIFEIFSVVNDNEQNITLTITAREVI